MADGEFRRIFLHEMHEVVAHLNAISSFAELLLQDGLNDVQLNQVNQVLDSSGLLQERLRVLQHLASK